MSAILIVEQVLSLIVKHGPAGVAAVQALVARGKGGTADLSDAEVTQALDALIADIDETSEAIAAYRKPD